MKKRIKNGVVLLVFLLIVFLNALILPKDKTENVDESEILLSEDVVENQWFEAWTLAETNIRREPSLESEILDTYNSGHYLHCYPYDENWTIVNYFCGGEYPNIITVYVESEFITDDVIVGEYLQLMNELEITKNKEEWFFEYKKFIAEHSNTYDQPTTIYDCFTDEEIYLMHRVIETECYGQDFISKANVASVLLNRINSGKFGETVVEVVTSPNQFVYGREIITKSTILALEYAFEIENTANGCIAFRSDKKVENWGDWKYVFSDDAGHHFYREKGE